MGFIRCFALLLTASNSKLRDKISNTGNIAKLSFFSYKAEVVRSTLFSPPIHKVRGFMTQIFYNIINLFCIFTFITFLKTVVEFMTSGLQHICMREQRQESEWILSCQRNMRLKWECTIDLCCHLFFFAVKVDVVTQFANEGALSWLLYTGDLVLMIETIMEVRNKFL